MSSANTFICMEERDEACPRQAAACRYCDSNLPKFPVKDTMGIFCFYCCDDCYEEQMSKFKPCTFGSREDYLDNMYAHGERLDDDY